MDFVSNIKWSSPFIKKFVRSWSATCVWHFLPPRGLGTILLCRFLPVIVASFVVGFILIIKVWKVVFEFFNERDLSCFSYVECVAIQNSQKIHNLLGYLLIFSKGCQKPAWIRSSYAFSELKQFSFSYHYCSKSSMHRWYQSKFLCPLLST